jgi:hypothetical protein
MHDQHSHSLPSFSLFKAMKPGLNTFCGSGALSTFMARPEREGNVDDGVFENLPVPLPLKF